MSKAMSEYMTRKQHLRIRKEDLERMEALEQKLEEAREFEEELVRKLTINKIGVLSDKEVVLSLRDYFKEQLKEKSE